MEDAGGHRCEVGTNGKDCAAKPRAGGGGRGDVTGATNYPVWALAPPFTVLMRNVQIHESNDLNTPACDM